MAGDTHPSQLSCGDPPTHRTGVTCFPSRLRKNRFAARLPFYFSSFIECKRLIFGVLSVPESHSRLSRHTAAPTYTAGTAAARLRMRTRL